MFNVCPACGVYDAAREVIAAPDSDSACARCASCGTEIPFRRRPLFVVTGASGAGKSTIGLELMRRDTGFLALESDILWGAIVALDDAGLDRYWNTWLRMIKNIHQGGSSVILCGTVEPDRLERQVERRYVAQTHYLALVTDPEEQARRLRQRPGARDSSDPEFIARHIRFNQWFIDQAGVGEPTWSILDTTNKSVANSADSVLDWVRLHQD
jgi:hypothetical protein